MWQELQARFAETGLTVVGVAVDAQGVAAARPWYEKYGVTYPRLVDPSNALGQAIGYKIVPNQFYVDELGVFHGNVAAERLAALLQRPQQALPKAFANRYRDAFSVDAAPAPAESPTPIADEFDALIASGSAALHSGDAVSAIALLARAAALRQDTVEVYTTLAAAHLAAGDKAKAADSLRSALMLDPQNWLIRKQIWAIEHPERFYNGPVDFEWQRAQRARESQSDP